MNDINVLGSTTWHAMPLSSPSPPAVLHTLLHVYKIPTSHPIPIPYKHKHKNKHEQALSLSFFPFSLSLSFLFVFPFHSSLLFFSDFNLSQISFSILFFLSFFLGCMCVCVCVCVCGFYDGDGVGGWGWDGWRFYKIAFFIPYSAESVIRRVERGG